MLGKSTALPILLALAMSVPAVAQENTTNEQTGSEQTGAEQIGDDTNIESELSLGEGVDNEPKVGEQYTSEKNGAWDIRCIKAEDGDDPCQMYQLLKDQNGSPIAEFTMFRLPEGGKARAGATVIVPLESSLQQQLIIEIDDTPGKRYPYAFCNSIGCYARIGMTEEDVQAYKLGNEARLTIVPALAPDQKVIVTLSLDGFTASYDKTSVVDP